MSTKGKKKFGRSREDKLAEIIQHITHVSGGRVCNSYIEGADLLDKVPSHLRETFRKVMSDE